MKRLGASVALAAATVVVSLMASWPAAVAAESPGIQISAPGSAEIGAEVHVRVHIVRDDGSPLASTPVVLTAESSFAGVTGRHVLAGATTDQNGDADLVYQQRAEDNGELRVEYELGGEQVFESFAIEVVGGGSVFRPQVGIRIPWLTGGWIVGLVVVVWSLIAFAASRIVIISRQDTATGEHLSPL